MASEHLDRIRRSVGEPLDISPPAAGGPELLGLREFLEDGRHTSR